MRDIFVKVPADLFALIEAAGRTADAAGMHAYVVGGFVRDMLLGRPHVDLDVTVEGDALRLAELFAAGYAGSRVVVHRRFGTATVHLADHRKVDFATCRREIYPHPASLPVVTPSSIKDDLFRRDFTINAMAVSIAHRDFGTLIDPYGGVADVRKKLVRVLHANSFSDDPTRIVRGIRFETRFAFRIEPHTLRLARHAARHGALTQVAAHRLRDELILVLKEPSPEACLRRIHHLAGFGFIDGHLQATPALFRRLRAAGRQIAWFYEVFPARRALDAWLVYLMALMSDMPLARLRRWCAHFGMRAGDTKRLLSVGVAQRGCVSRLCAHELVPSRLHALLDPLSYETILYLRASCEVPFFQTRIADFLAQYNGVKIEITGDDLAALGVAPGPAYQRILAELLAAKLDGKLHSRADELAMAKKLAGGSKL